MQAGASKTEAGVSNTYDLRGKTALVTGGGKGIGRAIAERLVASGSNVWVWDQHRVAYGGVHPELVDVTDAGQILPALARVTGATGRLDILVNNAGYLGRLQAFEIHQPEDWWKIIQVNLVGMMKVAQAVLPAMRAAGGGRARY